MGTSWSTVEAENREMKLECLQLAVELAKMSISKSFDTRETVPTLALAQEFYNWVTKEETHA